MLFGGLITANSRRRPPSSAQLGTSIANVRLMSAAKEDSCSRSGERLNPVNRLGSPLDKESRKPRKHFRLFPTLALLFEILTGKAVASQERAALRIGPWLQVPVKPPYRNVRIR